MGNEGLCRLDTPTAAVEQNTTKRRGVGLRALNSERASAGLTLFAPLIWGDGSVYLVDLHGNVVHTWTDERDRMEVSGPPDVEVCESSFGRFFEVAR